MAQKKALPVSKRKKAAAPIKSIAPANATYRWYSRTAGADRNSEAQGAHDVVLAAIYFLSDTGIHFEHVFDPVANTENLFIPAKVAESIGKELKLAGFIERLPSGNFQEQADLQEAILNGSDFNKTWS